MKALIEKRNELKAKQATLAKVFEEAGPDLDMSKVKLTGADGKALTSLQVVEKIREMNGELNTLGEELETLAGVEKAAQDQKGRDRLLEGGKIPQPGEGGSQDQRKQRKSLGQLFVESAAFKGFDRMQKRSPSAEIDLEKEYGEGVTLKTLLTETGYVPESVRSGTPLGPIVPGALRRPVVADLIPQGTTSQVAIKYMEETTTTNATTIVTEGGLKPESALAFTERTATVKKIATVLPVTEELFADVPAMRSYVEARMGQFLKLQEENELVWANNLPGMLNVASIQSQAKGADPTPDAIYKAMTKIRTVSFLEPSGVIIHPDDWTDIRLLRTADGIYIWGNPSEAGPERIWGLPAVITPAMTTDGTTTGTAIVAAFDMAMMIFRRSEIAFAVSDQHSDFFIYNKLMLRIEERLAFPVFRPTGICKVTGI